VGVRFSASVQIPPVAHQASCILAVFLEGKVAGV